MAHLLNQVARMDFFRRSVDSLISWQQIMAPVFDHPLWILEDYAITKSY